MTLRARCNAHSKEKRGDCLLRSALAVEQTGLRETMLRSGDAGDPDKHVVVIVQDGNLYKNTLSEPENTP